MLLEQIVRKQKDMIALRNRVNEVAASKMSFGPRASETGKVIGLRVPDELRARIERQQRAHGVRIYTQMLSMCITLGVEAMEMAEP